MFKKDYFPVAGTRTFAGDSPDGYDAEQAFLPYPLGTRDENPEAIIGFVGANAVPRVPKEQDLARHRRGCLTIDLLGLNRQDLILQRAQWLLWAVWANVKNVDARDAESLNFLADFEKEKCPFANCTRCFLDLCCNARPLAEAMIPEFKQIIASEV